jgi:phosphate transport system substrate-binding protein
LWGDGFEGVVGADDPQVYKARKSEMAQVWKSEWTEMQRIVRSRFFRKFGTSDWPSEKRPADGGRHGRRKGVFLASAAAVVLIAGTFAAIFHDRIFGPSEHIILSLHGSTSLGDELVPKIAEAFLRDELGATETGLRVKSTDAGGHSRLHVWGKVPGKPGQQVIEIYANGSGAAFKCLSVADGPDYCDIGMSSRPISDSDMRLFPNRSNLADRPTEHVVALDGIAVVVNPHNPVSHLAIPQLRAIYSGQIRNWKDVGGDDAPIDLYGRDSNSGTLEMFTEKVMGKDSLATARMAALPQIRQIGDSSLIVDAVLRSRNAIGFVSSPLIGEAKALSISDGSGPALRPTELSIVTEDYPICRRLLLYHWDVPGSMMNAFIRYATYKPGQAIVAKTPFVGLIPNVFPVVPTQRAPIAYKRIAARFSRIGLSFHFSSAQAEAAENSDRQLDNLASMNVLRLRTFLSQRGGTGDDILLLGFADEMEGQVPYEHLAHQRAESVATKLRAVGVLVSPGNIKDFGVNLPVASNDTPEGRSKNRRVEVWVRNGLL